MKQKQLHFLNALLTESSISAAAKKAEISRETARKYLNDSEFKAELDRCRSECLNDTVRFLQSKLTVCSEQLVRIIENEDTADQVKINAVNAVFQNFRLVGGLDFVEERVGDNMKRGSKETKISAYLRLAEMCGIDDEAKKKAYMKKVEELLQENDEQSK